VSASLWCQELLFGGGRPAFTWRGRSPIKAVGHLGGFLWISHPGIRPGPSVTLSTSCGVRPGRRCPPCSARRRRHSTEPNASAVADLLDAPAPRPFSFRPRHAGSFLRTAIRTGQAPRHPGGSLGGSLDADPPPGRCARIAPQ
jgi:hypothetical protein